MKIKNIFNRKKKNMGEPQPLQVQDIADTPITAEPDNAEVAAQAILDVLIDMRHKAAQKYIRKHGKTDIEPEREPKMKPAKVMAPHDAKYYHHLADRIRQAYDSSRLRAMRFLSWCEQELKKSDLPMTGDGSLALIEAELYKRIDIVDREGGKLKERWQHCLAEVTIRLMQAQRKESDESGTPKK